MIRINEPSSLSRHLLVYSDQSDPTLARQEITAWAASSGYHVSETPRMVSIFDSGQVVREWMVLDRAVPSPASVSTRRQMPTARLRFRLPARRASDHSRQAVR